MAKDRIDRAELADKLLEGVTSAEDPLRAMAEMVEFDGRGITYPKGGAKRRLGSTAKDGETRRIDLDGERGRAPVVLRGVAGAPAEGVVEDAKRLDPGEGFPLSTLFHDTNCAQDEGRFKAERQQI